MQTKFKDFLFSRLPVYFYKNDSYKDPNNKGLLQRFTEVLGEEIDEEIVTRLEDHLSILNINNSDTKYLPHIADSLGNPPDINLDVEQYSNLLSFITSYYKIKGTVAGYDFFFSLLNLDVEIEEFPAVKLTMDSGLKMDTTDINSDPYKMDDNCAKCTYYDLTFTNREDKDNNIGAFTATNFQNIRLAVLYNEPINAKLLNLNQKLTFKDNYFTCIEEQITVYNRVTLELDQANIMDNSLTMDLASQVQQVQITDESPYCAILVGDFNNDFNNDYR